MAMTVGHREGQAYSQINMTPLIDVMLVLLIIFIITLPNQTHAIKMDAPVAAAVSDSPEVVNLSIDFDGTLAWNERRIDRRELQDYIGRAVSKSPQPEVRIRADRFAKYEVVAQTLADLQRHGLKRVGFVKDD